MTSKHDLFTLIITLAVLGSAVVLVVTNHTDTTILTALGAAFSAIVAYWFTRGGSYMGQSQQPDVNAIVGAAVQNTLNQLAQSPANPAPGMGVPVGQANGAGNGSH